MVVGNKFMININDNDIIVIDGLRYYVPDKNDYIYKNMIKNNESWEKNISNKLMSFIKEGTSVIDVGAHVGTHSLMFSKRAKNVFSFEPVEDHCKIFRINVELNNLKNIFLFDKAVSYKETNLSIDPICYSKRLNNSGATYLIEKEDGEIKGDSLDNLLLLSGVLNEDTISVIKYDVEEMEYEAILGSVNIIKKYKPILYVEFINPKKRKKGNGDKVKEFLYKMGYRPISNETEIWEHTGEL